MARTGWPEIFAKAFSSAIPKGVDRLAGSFLPGVSAALAGIVLARRSPVRCAWVLVPSVVDQDRVYADLCSLSRTAEISPMLFPQLTEGDAVAAGNRARVIRTMRGIADQSPEEDRSDGEVPRVVVATMAAFTQPAPDPDLLNRGTITLKVGGCFEFDELVRRLCDAGYRRVTDVFDPGELAVRGGVLDIWPPQAKAPWRAEFFGTELESLRMFDPSTQLSVESGKSAWLPPCFGEAIKTVQVPEVLPEGVALLWQNFEAMRLDTPSATEWDRLQEAVAASKPHFQFFTGDPPPPRTPTLELPVASVPGLADAADDGELYSDLLARHRRNLLEFFSGQAAEGERVFVCADTAGTCEMLAREIGDDSGIEIQKFAISGGFSLPGLLVVGQTDLFSSRRKNVRRAVSGTSVAGARIEQVSELEPGDLVVHLNHGIGRFLGSTEIIVEGRRYEVFSIEYAGGVKIHVPVSQAHLLSRYVGVAGREDAKLHNLSGKRWLSEKADAERAVQDLAASLLETQARRSVVPGVAFDPSPMYMQEFEAAFPYTETPDQHKAVEDVKRDMSLPKPMDRLICGDAGYGKTEVAMRAAFLAVMNGRQVAVLVPTTVLAEQHYETFKERMAAFPVNIGVVSRFHSPAACEQALAAAATGRVDILIGTHALLADGVSFKDLGLLIIDEEQRFGVVHKEKLKTARQIVDVLTLTATPIPRTLYLSMVGARDMSLLQTPPQERLAVETRVAKDSDQTLRQAVMQEVCRGGQVYFLYNRVKTIDMMRQRLESLLPELRIEVAHGQLPSGELSRKMEAFEAGEIDVLLCTTIVESGLDIPRANTIIVHRADRFGLASLYQLRGRVGRSSLKGYAWLLLPDHGQIDAIARERLDALRKHGGLGAGFGLAMRDLEIRGSGNLLGIQQSGHIAAIGFGLYCQLLKRTIARLKGEKPPLLVDVETQFDFMDYSPGVIDPDRSACIPYGYIEDDGHRMLFHRKIAEANSAKDIKSIRREMSDRYGTPPKPVDRALKLALLRITAAERRISRITVRDGKIYMFRRKDRVAPVTIAGNIPLLSGKNADAKLTSIIKTIEQVK
ncbi:MAG: transcription-repair coupling factor [Kiritimatiellae bacterium]|nr:transcription-repair coupling factor [Kiritimatiellia bacterium]